MPFTDAPPPPGKPKIGTGISMSLQSLKGGRMKARITFSAEIQKTIFGGPIAGSKFQVRVGRGSDEGKLLVVRTEDGDFTASDGVKGSSSLTVGAWDLLPKSKRPAASVEVASRPSNFEVVLKLPEWCRPSGATGRMAEEHGLKGPGKPTRRP
jgi:hypothetical protein